MTVVCPEQRLVTHDISSGMDRDIAPRDFLGHRQEAAVEVTWRRALLERWLLGAGGEDVRAARRERAARRQRAQRGRLPRDGRQAVRLGTVDARDRAQQPPGVGVLRVREQLALGAVLDDAARVHHAHAVGDVGDDAHVVRDEDDRGAEIALQPAQQREDLRLDRDVERSRRLVGDQQIGVARERHGDHRALPHAARELVRVVVGAHGGAGDADGVEQFDRTLVRLRLRHGLVRPHLLGDLPADAIDRVERRHRVLEDHRDLRSPHAPHLVGRELEEIAPLVDHLARRDRVRVADQTHDRHRGHALARAGLADDAEHLTGRDGERDAVDRAHEAVLGAERDVQVAHLEERLASQRAPADRAGRRRCRRRRWPGR